jgi:hypothetical protein
MMANKHSGLTGLSTTDLERLLRAVHRGELSCPLSHASLHVAGLSYLVDRVEALQGLDERGVRAVLVAVLAERRQQERAANR